MRFVRTVLALSVTTILILPATALARRTSGSRHRKSIASHVRTEIRIPEDGVTTLEPFGPLPADELKAENAQRDEKTETSDIIEKVAVVDVHDDDAPCTQDEIASGGCDDDEADGTDLEEVPAGDLAKKSALHSVVSAMKKVGALFRPKSSETLLSPEDEYLQELLSMNLEIPVEGVTRDRLQDSFLNPRGGRRHHYQHLALDIGSPKGTPVLAVTDGEVVRIGREKRGGNAIYLRDASNRYLFYYCHLSHYAHGLMAGMKVKKGEILGQVGATGNAHGAHLHFSVTRLPDDSLALDFKKGLAVNPYLVFLFAK
ncbi:MAG TPA: M23 family metallopeptidase [Thermoanaerobaculia bacterium]|nr:M23 family metallopeptidase [Thermoanaerobaculia bacterium]